MSRRRVLLQQTDSQLVAEHCSASSETDKSDSFSAYRRCCLRPSLWTGGGPPPPSSCPSSGHPARPAPRARSRRPALRSPRPAAGSGEGVRRWQGESENEVAGVHWKEVSWQDKTIRQPSPELSSRPTKQAAPWGSSEWRGRWRCAASARPTFGCPSRPRACRTCASAMPPKRYSAIEAAAAGEAHVAAWDSAPQACWQLASLTPWAGA